MAYEILQPNTYDTSEFAGTASGTWENVPDGECETLDEARETVATLQADGWGKLAIREVRSRYPYEIIDPE